MTTASLAVVISTYNAPHFLRLVLEGYRRQHDTNFSIYIADDGSTEETTRLIQQMQDDFPVKIHHFRQKDKGFRKARIHNRVIQKIHEPQTLLTDGDCIPLPELVATHRRVAGGGYFINGSRILISRQYTHHLCKLNAFETNRSSIWWFKQRISAHINRFTPLFMPVSLSRPSRQLEGIRGCHLACPTTALHRVNGFDENFEGWGREDSDLCARLLHAGLSRRNLRGQPVLHLWHPESSRQHLAQNDHILQACLDERRIEAVTGLKELDGEKHAS